MRKRFLFGIFTIAFCGFALGQGSTSGTVVLHIQPQFLGQNIALDGQLYHSPKGDSLYLDVLRFYLSSVELHGAKGIFKEKNSYHLIDVERPSTSKIVLQNVPTGRYDSLCLFIGTDSLTNISGAMGGDLDPTKGMYWAWNTGYINFKIEGRSNACNTRHHAFEFHIGGYKAPYQTVRKIVLPLKNTAVVRENAIAAIIVKADLGKFFSQIQLSSTNSILMPSQNAALMADYFQQIFSAE